MNQVLWLSREDVLHTGVCNIDFAKKSVEQIFRLFDNDKALIIPESALHLSADGHDHACYCLPAYVGGEQPVCGIKWTAHGDAVNADSTASRIQATVVLTNPSSGYPLAVMNGTEIGGARTGAVTAIALQQLAPLGCKKVALCGAGGQAERQLQAVLSVLPDVKEVAVWSRGYKRAINLTARYGDKTHIALNPTASVDEAVQGADVIIAATSADMPYMTPQRLRDASLYCHIGFNEITPEGLNVFSSIVVDTWEEAKDVSGQSLFRCYRDGLISRERITGTLGSMITGKLNVQRSTVEQKVMFDAFGLPIFDIGLAFAAYQSAKQGGFGTLIPW